ncbi:hypothetical protein CsSME_00016028 [Camellia sinensis var. sinensis]
MLFEIITNCILSQFCFFLSLIIILFMEMWVGSRVDGVRVYFATSDCIPRQYNQDMC